MSSFPPLSFPFALMTQLFSSACHTWSLSTMVPYVTVSSECSPPASTIILFKPSWLSHLVPRWTFSPSSWVSCPEACLSLECLQPRPEFRPILNITSWPAPHSPQPPIYGIHPPLTEAVKGPRGHQGGLWQAWDRTIGTSVIEQSRCENSSSSTSWLGR